MQLPILFTLFVALANAVPVPKMVTQVVTAEAVTVTQDTTIQTTITIPVEEIIIVGDHTITTTYLTHTAVTGDTTPNGVTLTHSNAEPTLVGVANIAGPGYNGVTAESSTVEAAHTLATETSTSSTETSTSTSSTKTSTSSTETSTSSATQGIVIPGVTTLPVGETFVPDLSGMIQSNDLVPSTIALTTTTVQSGQAVTTSTGLKLALSTTNGKAIIGELTEGLQKDSNVANTMNNPQTISVTNSDISTVTTPTTTSTSTTSSTSSAGTTGTTGTTETSQAAATLLTKAPKVIVYSPYSDSGACKAYQEVYQNLALIKSKGINEVRVYGTDCNYMTTILPIASKFGMKVNQGFWISQDGADSIDVPVDNFIEYIKSSAADYDWSLFSYITIGNEAIISNFCSVDQLIAKISEVKAKLRAAGYNGDVTTSEPPVTFENNPKLCTGSEIDFVGVNPHSYFSPSFSAAQSGAFVKNEVNIVEQLCGGKKIVVTETGYPHAGIQNGDNIPSAENQLIALQSIFDDYGTDVVILTTFDDYWKQPGPYGIERAFGMIDLLPVV